MRTHLPPLIARNLNVVFVGTSPGADSLASGNYYANPRNSFYSDLHLTGWTDRQLSPSEFRLLPGFGIGIDDVYDDPGSLRRRIEDCLPTAVCFNSKGALQAFAGRVDPERWRGEAAMQWAKLTKVEIAWAVPDSSGLAAAYGTQRRELLRELRRRVFEQESRIRL